MEQARNYVCKECASPVPAGHKFCGGCGGEVPIQVQTGQVDFFGAMQTPGKARLIRGGEVLFRGDVASLRRHKDDVKEVGTGFECGIGLAGFNEMQEGDIIEAYELVQIEATL